MSMALIQLNISNLPVEKRSPLDNPSVSLGNVGAVLSWISGSEPTASGEIIDQHTALQITTVYGCVRLIAETIGSLPLKLYEKLSKGRREAIDNSLHDLLAVSPNPEQGSVVFWESVVGAMCLDGNSYVYIQRSGSQVLALWPLNPQKTKPIRLPDGTLAYQTHDGFTNGQSRIYQASEILHFRLFNPFDGGLLGLSPIHLARQSLGLNRAAEKTAARLYSNGLRPSGVMSTDANLDEQTLLNIRESWMAANSSENSFKTAFLTGGWKYQAIGLDLEAVQFLQSRAYQRSEVCALYRCPTHLLGDTTRQSNTNNEQEMLSLVTLTLRPYLERIENEIERVLLPSVGRNAGRYEVEFDTKGLLRGDWKTTMESYALGKQWGFYSTNHILEELGENPIPPGPDGKSIGDVYIVPVNYQNMEKLLELDEPQQQPNEPKTSMNEMQMEQERSIVQRASSLTVVFRDAMGRLLNREQKDSATISTIFQPCLRAITALSAQDASKRLRTDWSDQKTEERIVSDALKGIEKRSADWTAETLETVCADEFRRCLKSIVSAVYRECAAALVNY